MIIYGNLRQGKGTVKNQMHIHEIGNQSILVNEPESYVHLKSKPKHTICIYIYT